MHTISARSLYLGRPVKNGFIHTHKLANKSSETYKDSRFRNFDQFEHMMSLYKCTIPT